MKVMYVHAYTRLVSCLALYGLSKSHLEPGFVRLEIMPEVTVWLTVGYLIRHVLPALHRPCEVELICMREHSTQDQPS